MLARQHLLDVGPLLMKLAQRVLVLQQAMWNGGLWVLVI